ncbi:MAG: hypothetical protein E4H02_11455, partial [Lentisphaerales bacterium]
MNLPNMTIACERSRRRMVGCASIAGARRAAGDRGIAGKFHFPGLTLSGAIALRLMLVFCATLLVALAQTASSVDATGGNSTNDTGGYRIHTFTSGGNFIVTTGGDVEYLIVAGGGGGGGGVQGGGGGAGGYLTGSATLSATTYGITVGAGGNGCTDSPDVAAINGDDSVIQDIATAIGGGRGASETPDAYASVGGSGGAGTWKDASYLPGTNGTSGQGYAGGDGFQIDGDNIGGGGGGGSSSVGTNATTGVMQPAGGAGTSSSISGAPVTYAAGGAG